VQCSRPFPFPAKLIAKRRLPSVEHPYQAPLRKGRQGIDGATGADPLSEYRALKNATYNAWIDAELARVEKAKMEYRCSVNQKSRENFEVGNIWLHKQDSDVEPIG